MGVCTGTFQSPNGSPVANGRFLWKLSSDAIVISTAANAPTIISGVLDSSGNLTSTFNFNDVLTASAGPTTYQLTVKDKFGSQVWNESYFLSGSSANLNTAVPAGAPGVQITVPLTQVAMGNVGGAITIPLQNFYVQYVTMTLTANATSALNVSGLQTGSYVTFDITQDGTGSRTFAWPAGTIQPMVIGPTAGQNSVQLFVWNGSNLKAQGPGVLNP